MIRAITQTPSVNPRTPGTCSGRVAPAMATMPVPITAANQLGPILPRTSTRFRGAGTSLGAAASLTP